MNFDLSNATKLEHELEILSEKIPRLRQEIGKQFIGQEKTLDLVLTTILAGGHGLLIGAPGLGKTKLVEALGHALGLKSGRVQFTPDLMPSDILGAEILERDKEGNRSFRFIKGPIFCELLLADEINRASPRTQSALLQAMQERRISIAGQTLPLGTPFQVFATQNPIEYEGTYPLPEAQLDRFLCSIKLPYPSFEAEREIIIATMGNAEMDIDPVFSAESLVAAQQSTKRLPVGENLLDAVLQLVRMLRPHTQEALENTNQYIEWGPGPRATQALIAGMRAHALLRGALAPSYEDLQALAQPMLSHRMALTYRARVENIELSHLIDQAVRASIQHRRTG